MISRTVQLLVVLGLIVGVIGCAPPETPMPTATPQSLAAPVAAAQSEPTEAPPTETPIAVDTATPAVIEVVVTATPETADEEGPELLAPPDGLEASLFDLMWEWEPGLEDDEWYELQVWPNTPDAEPSVFTWLKETTRRITAAHLLPGEYRWRVVVVEGYDDTRGDETSPFSQERTFIMTRPSTISTVELPIIPTRTPTPRTIIIVVTATPTATTEATIPTPTETVPAPTATSTVPNTPTTVATVPPATVAPPTAYPGP
jgi:hypothetical protein